MSRMASIRSFLILLVLLGGYQTTAKSATAVPRIVSIEEARGMSTGETVRISGVVTVPSGAFASSISSGFAVQDDTAGIYVLDSSYAFELGQRVEVTGKRGEEHGQSHIILEFADKLAGSGRVTPKAIKTGDVGEDEAGFVIRIEGYVVRTKPDPPYGYKAFIDDGSGECQIFFDASTGLVEDARDWKVGDFLSVTGFSGQYEQTYEVMPRIFSDITIRSAQE